MIRIIQGGHFNRPVSCSRLFSSRPSSSYHFVPSFRKPSSRFVMYTNCCCSCYSVSNVDLLPSLSQLNSSIKIFSWLPVYSVGSTCSSSCFFVFPSFRRVSWPPSPVPREALLPQDSLWTPNTSSLIRHYPF